MQLSLGTWYKLSLIVQGGWQCGWDGHLQDSSHVEREGDTFQVVSQRFVLR